MACRLAAALTLMLGAACGAKSALQGPLPCEAPEDCPAEPFCGPVPLCVDGRCALGPPRDCDDGDACTVDRCDEASASCETRLRDADTDGYGDASCGGDDCDDDDLGVNPGATERCADDVDNDCDRRTDCSDSECADDPSCEGCLPEMCLNRTDDDCDGRADCDDTDCDDAPACCRASEADCADGRDEDCDGDVDCLDADCEDDAACCVPDREVCDGLDNDCDGVADDGIGCFFLGSTPLEPISSSQCGRAFYAYGVPDDASANPAPDVRRSDVVVVFVHEGPCGATVSVIADTPNDGGGGQLDARFTIEPRTAGDIVQGDEPAPNEECRYDARAGSGRCSWEWFPCCTDGVMLGEFTRDFCVEITLSRPVGLDEVEVLDGPGRTIRASFEAPIRICGTLVPEA